jgi:hypothetical protein
MSFEGDKIMLSGLVEIVLPTKTIRICDGAFLYVGADKFASFDDEFGSIESLELPEENVGDEAPSGSMVFLPVDTAAAADLSQPGFQGSPIRFWQAQVDEATGTVIGTPELLADCELDTTVLKIGPRSRRLEIGFIQAAERLFSINEGNVLSPRFHKSIWPGELGFDNATGIGTAVAWGVAGGPRGSSMSGAGGGGAGGLGGSDDGFGRFGNSAAF